MPSVKPARILSEHFVTLFDSNFLPMGMCLHSSLMEHARPFHLWVLCMDKLVEDQLRELALPNVSLIALEDVETKRLLEVKAERSKGEYCWTLTPFTSEFVFARDARVQRVTYLDADLFFFDNPDVLLDEFTASGKHVLITEHSYAREYDQSATSGIFCVQFMTFRRTKQALDVMSWWQDRCLEWCFNRVEDGKFGDQKYLDDWPARFSDEVHVSVHIEKTLAPWNLTRFDRKDTVLKPVLYHFHGLRLTHPNKVILFADYKLRGRGGVIYDRYISTLQKAVSSMQAYKMAIPVTPAKKVPLQSLRNAKAYLLGRMASARLY